MNNLWFGTCLGFQGKGSVGKLNPAIPKLSPKVAILYQAAPPPSIGGIPKPMKPGGYSDSGADIAYNLKRHNIDVVTPVADPDPSKQFEWVYPDTPEGIRAALADGATILWANTVLFTEHPLRLLSDIPSIHIIGQPPSLAQKYDDKWVTNQELKLSGLPIAPSCLVSCSPPFSAGAININQLSEERLTAEGLTFPLVVKPVRGRGSQGVYLVPSFSELCNQIQKLLTETDKIEDRVYTKYGQDFIVEQYMAGQEVTITVMPPGAYTIYGHTCQKDYWSLPIVKRFNHIDGIAPYNGLVAIINNSALLDEQEHADPRYTLLQRACEKAAKIVGARAPIRIDCREGKDGKFYLFDLNMKPNLTGPGRPGRDDQDSLTSLAARSPEIGWDYSALLLNMYSQAWPVSLIENNICAQEENITSSHYLRARL